MGEAWKRRCVLGPRRVSKVGTDSADPLIQGFNPLDRLETARPIGLCVTTTRFANALTGAPSICLSNSH